MVKFFLWFLAIEILSLLKEDQTAHTLNFCVKIYKRSFSTLAAGSQGAKGIERLGEAAGIGEGPHGPQAGGEHAEMYAGAGACAGAHQSSPRPNVGGRPGRTAPSPESPPPPPQAPTE